MSDAPKYNIQTFHANGEDDKSYLLLPIEVSPKGVRTVVMDLDDYEIIENGTKEKNKLPVMYIKFKLIESKTK